MNNRDEEQGFPPPNGIGEEVSYTPTEEEREPIYFEDQRDPPPYIKVINNAGLFYRQNPFKISARLHQFTIDWLKNRKWDEVTMKLIFFPPEVEETTGISGKIVMKYRKPFPKSTGPKGGRPPRSERFAFKEED